MEENRKPKQVERILDYLRTHKQITQLDAYQDLGIMRLGARMWEIQHQLGIPVITEIIEVKNRRGETCHVAAYRLSDKEVIA